MTIVDEHGPEVGVAPACRAVDVSRATWYRRRKKDRVRQIKPRRQPPRRLSDAERERIVNILCSDEFVDRSPRAVYAILLERGEYLCSVRTMYRILAEQKAVRNVGRSGNIRNTPCRSAVHADPTISGAGTSPSSPARIARGSAST